MVKRKKSLEKMQSKFNFSYKSFRNYFFPVLYLALLVIPTTRLAILEFNGQSTPIDEYVTGLIVLFLFFLFFVTGAPE
jgi:hypothetical protein